MTLPAGSGPAATSGVMCAPWASFADLTAAQQALATEPVWDRALWIASEILYAASGRRWRGAGCAREWTSGLCVCGFDWTWWAWDGIGAWTEWSLRRAGRRCLCDLTVIQLPHRDNVHVTAVTVDGVLVDPAGYRVSTDGTLRRVDGSWWPPFLDRTVVAYTHGWAPPLAGVDAVIAFAVELIKAAVGDGTCQLPKRVTSLTRQGVTVAMLDPQNYLKDGRLGLPAVDAWLSVANPDRARQPARVWTPDMGTSRGNTRPI